jgi:beta-lactamase class D
MSGTTIPPMWSRRRVLRAAGLATAAVGLGTGAQAVDRVERSDLWDAFERLGVDGTFALYEPGADRLCLVAAKRAALRYVPASTFKIANSLIALKRAW